MKIDIDEGKYVIAVSGGVDSMVLLDVLRRKPKIRLIVAHFNHGIRSDSWVDEQLVAKTAKHYSLPIEIGAGQLGSSASEATARAARYKFLEQLRQKHLANAIITAHHQDDLIETAFLNLLRGTKRKGLSSIYSSKIVRPLLNTPKKEILAYAKQNHIKWREDSTNTDERYLRNYLRNTILPKITDSQKQHLIINLNNIADTNQNIDRQIAIISQSIVKANKLDRRKFVMLPAEIAKETLVNWLRSFGIRQLSKRRLTDLFIFIKTGGSGARQPVTRGHEVVLDVNFATWR